MIPLVKSKTAPTNKYCIWLDITTDTKVFRVYNNGEWIPIGGIDDTVLQAIASLEEHIADNNNPHKVTKDLVGLGKVTNVAPADLPVSTATLEALTSMLSTIQTQLTTTLDEYEKKALASLDATDKALEDVQDDLDSKLNYEELTADEFSKLDVKDTNTLYLITN